MTCELLSTRLSHEALKTHRCSDKHPIKVPLLIEPIPSSLSIFLALDLQSQRRLEALQLAPEPIALDIDIQCTQQLLSTLLSTNYRFG
jgi:hypothetical protein